jgi:hypothetical protein
VVLLLLLQVIIRGIPMVCHILLHITVCWLLLRLLLLLQVKICYDPVTNPLLL